MPAYADGLAVILPPLSLTNIVHTTLFELLCTCPDASSSDGTASRVRQNLLDLLPITQSSIVLPLSSYSLKVVEQYVGFRRTQDEHGGQWAMAKYIEAVETEDPDTRAELMEEIFKYNEEDLGATWEVLKWLRQK